MTVELDTPLTAAVGEKTAKLLARAFEMATVGELLTHYPRRYAPRGELTRIGELPLGEQVTIIAEVIRVSERTMRQRRGSLLEAWITDGTDEMKLTFFSQGWRKNELLPGRRGIFAGKVTEFNGAMQFAHPMYELFENEGDLDADAWAKAPLPIYPATAQVSSWDLRRLILTLLDELGEVEDPLPASFRRDRKLLPAREALTRIHRPESEEDAFRAQHTLRMHEALVMQTALLQQRAEVQAMHAIARPAGSLLAAFDAALPFERTPDQQSVGETIARDLTGAHPMNRLVQGEVGSGKTLVALRAMLQVAESGGQSALIAPTEVLAGQHLRSIAKLLGPQTLAELMPALLTGQMTAPERRKAALRVASGQARIVVGTHALLSEKTSFADLGLVVIDEQHRFGVEQREALRAKGTAPHVLVLTATPIPRTVAMTVFGDLDVSTIRTLPAGRAGIRTFVAPLAEKPSWFARVWERAAEEIAVGRQVFVVASLIDSDDGAEEEGAAEEVEAPAPGGTRWGVVQVADMLSRHPSFSGIRVEILHGRMTADEKERVMQGLVSGDIDLVVATTVIEVGVDIPNASTMIILDADRFGVSQLHQLRGRVGRGEHAGLCLLVTEAAEGTVARERVEAVAATRDGFELAEVDLELRGEGDVLGARQSGVRSSLKLLRVIKDRAMIVAAREEAERILAEDPSLARHPELARGISRRVGAEERAALGKG